MPNWVTNRIAFSSKEAYELFKSKYVREDPEDPDAETFDFNLLIPMPEPLNIEEGTRTDDGIGIVLLRMRQQNVPGTKKVMEAVERSKKKDWIARLFQQRETDAQIEEAAAHYEKLGKLDEVLELGKKAIQNILDYGYSSWYKWAVANWGTKWNACEYRDDPDALEVWFETAWSTPAPVIERLVGIMGADAFEEIEYADEDIGGNCGRFFLDEGGPTFAIPDDRQSDQAMERAIRLNNAYDYYELRDGHWVCKDDDEEDAGTVETVAAA